MGNNFFLRTFVSVYKTHVCLFPFQFICAKSGNKPIHWGNDIHLILGHYSYSFVCTFDREHAVQKYLESLTVRVEEWRLKRKDSEEWMKHRQLPQDLRERVRRFIQYKWLATQGVDEESILRALPPDLRREIRRHLCLDLVKRVPFFSQMDDQLLDAICGRLVSSLSIEGTYIVREGDPLTQMLFIIRGRLESSTTDGGRTGFFNSTTLWPGDFCGEELLTWALLPKSTLNLPSSTRTVRAVDEVEAFALHAQDLKFVANQFRRLHNKKLQHTFRFYSHQWRTWAACSIQAGWRRYKRRKNKSKDKRLQESLSFDLAEHVVIGTKREDEDMESPLENPSPAKQNLGVKIMLSTFAANRKRRAQRPEEPDFSDYHDKDD
ncbi:putative cyclic nucleotide-gated ion channel 14 [Cinnamomum micranthum f. kanehirae]|uniref:Putative cyclic nucleotide-gated ion channel 14 n=1 Tax=Cinnamomum micranthum f. kanehirae TaxID=337451 RepID=A0A3S3NFP3_9MAGN|nr:putative cyclic nucleotide-gated ion channel 14 [Cinnamomum micranthum f. kanehirae]